MNSLLTMTRCLSILAMALSLGGAQAQDAFPDKPVKLIVPVAVSTRLFVPSPRIGVSCWVNRWWLKTARVPVR